MERNFIEKVQGSGILKQP